MNAIRSILCDVKIPKMFKVRQRFNTDELTNVQDELNLQLMSSKGSRDIRKGMSVAVCAGSRGINNIDVITKTTIDYLKAKGANPFIVTAMGSHGGATAQGQIDILASFNITEETMGVPIKAGTDVVKICTLEDGLPVYVDSSALAADGIVVINRIKPHTGFHGKYESGLMKMLVVGLGNQKGADIIHKDGTSFIVDKISRIGKVILRETNVLFGVAVIENAMDRTARIRVLSKDEFETEEPKLLEEARSHMPRIMFDHLDVLIVDRIGKNISGGGMDSNIVGGFISDSGEVITEKPKRITVLDLTEETHGSAFGIGSADTTTKKVFDKIDFSTTYPNALTTGTPEFVKIPMVMENHESAIQAAIKMALGTDQSNLRIVRIEDTLHIGELFASECMLPEAMENPQIEILSEAEDLIFDANGNLF